MLKAVQNVNTILNEALHGHDILIKRVDRLMIQLDGTEINRI